MEDETNRPDPDELLSQITAQEGEDERQLRGALKIFFGACAGVGKTYSMLNAGQQALQQGRDVLIGVVETHGRKDTENLLEGVPILPRKEIEYKGAVLKEFDLDAALERKPELILIDELAHTNAPGSRHPKRWQDIEELLAAGIDVYTTVNVQHIESLNDVVARITGVWVRETVPDSFFESSGSIALVDIPTEELLQRLKEGKVYIAPGAKQRAAQNFFKKENLIALRELALRQTAERVDAQMDSYKHVSGNADAWSGADKVMVCIGPDELSSKLVRVAKRTSAGMKAPWTAIYVENEKHYKLSPEGQSATERTLKLAERMGGDTVVIKADDAPRAIIEYARKHNYTKIIVGKVPRAKWREVIKGTLADSIIRISGDIDVYVVTGEMQGEQQTYNKRWEPLSLTGCLAPLWVVALTTIIAYPLRGTVDTLNTGGLYLIGVVWLALRYGHTTSFIGALLAAAAFDFFLLPPYWNFNVTESKHVFALIIMAGTGLIIAKLTSRMRLQTIYAQKREEKTAALYALSKELTATRGKKNLVDTAAQHIGHILNADISVWLPDEKGQLQCFMAERPEDEQEDHLKEESAVSWAFKHRQPAGIGTETLPNASGYYIPMLSGMKTIGVVGLLPENKKELNNEQINLLDNIVNIIATAVDRANAAEMVENAVVESEGEKLRNIILSSVSHDLRTPLASISGAASTLLMEEGKISKEYSSELLKLIHEEAARLARMVTNLLDVTSLQSGSVKLNKELYFIEELISSAIMRVESRLGNRNVDIKISQGMPLILMDGLLIEQVMINLLDNIIDHTPDGTQVSISAQINKPDLHVILQDNGPGIPTGEEERIFERSYANANPHNIKEGRMGLAICRGIITAHDGKIWAQKASEGGAIFTFTLPLRQNHGEEK